MITATDKLKCAERELRMRQGVYPKWVRAGRMKAENAEREIAVMAAIVADYRAAAVFTHQIPADYGSDEVGC